mmetsp:Transcript_24655/g.79703  ORF Transcript_24655/g.79703 Transcript_24655/m.79703 type:complete len:211 (-) Transcript_24655:334-966(-)
MRVTETTAASRGLVSRAAKICKLETTWAAATMGSTVMWGMAAWPPTPEMRMSNKSVAAIWVPGLAPRVPMGRKGHWWKPKAAMGLGSFVKTPSSTIRLPPAPPSSAGWKIMRTVPLIIASRFFKTAAAPRSIAACASWPHACITPLISDSKGNFNAFDSRMGRASMSARSKTHGSPPVPMSATTPVPPRPDLKPLASSSSCFVFTAQPPE